MLGSLKNKVPTQMGKANQAWPYLGGVPLFGFILDNRCRIGITQHWFWSPAENRPDVSGRTGLASFRWRYGQDKDHRSEVSFSTGKERFRSALGQCANLDQAGLTAEIARER